jgi:hypothetical protein
VALKIGSEKLPDGTEINTNSDVPKQSRAAHSPGLNKALVIANFINSGKGLTVRTWVIRDDSPNGGSKYAVVANSRDGKKCKLKRRIQDLLRMMLPCKMTLTITFVERIYKNLKD